MQTYVVIGLGRFGFATAARLFSVGNEVLAIDQDPELVQKISGSVTHAVVADARDASVLKTIGVGECDCAVVAIGEDLASSILITLALKDLGIKKVVCKAKSEIHKQALEKVGADRVVIPEREMAYKLAASLTSSDVLDFIELSEDYGIAEIAVPESWTGASIRQLDIRAKYGVNILAVRRPDGSLQVSPPPDLVFSKASVAVILGSNEQIARMQKYETGNRNK